MGEKISLDKAKKIVKFFGDSREEYRSGFGQARQAFQNRKEGDDQFVINGQNITLSELSLLLNECYGISHSTLELRPFLEYDLKERDVAAKIPLNARQVVRKLMIILGQIPGAKVPPCPPELEAWLKEE